MSGNGEQVTSSSAIEHLRWALTPEVGPVLFGRLIERFGSAQHALGASVAQLQEVEGIGPSIAEQIARGRDAVDVQQEVALAAKHNVRILCRDDEEYPAGLRHIPDAPICLYVRGRLEAEDAIAVAIVGARRCTLYGREQAERFGYVLASRGLVIVSGLARGIDGESHKGAIKAGGRTIAVLGNGLSRIYPPEHRELADRMAECGAVISELPMTTAPDASNFLPRNRLIAGLSLGVLVIEAARRSGALATARLATEYNREVFALPGRVDSDYSVGTNQLIRDQHAKLVTCADDLIDELGGVGEALSCAEDLASRQGETDGTASPTIASTLLSTLTDDERCVAAVLDRQEQSIEVIAAATGQSAAQVATTLITLQLKGIARQLPGNLFVRSRNK